MKNPLAPTPQTLTKLGSIVRHIEEATSQGGHAFDWTAIGGLLADPDVQAWLHAMDGLALLPVHREDQPTHGLRGQVRP